MRTQFPREWSTYKYRSARDFLVNVLPLRAALAVSNTEARIHNLRTSKLKEERELWQACLFAHGIGSAVLSTEVCLAPVEADDYDCVARYIIGDTQHYVPIQLKEFVPEHLNPSTSLEVELEKLKKKCVDSRDLVIAIYLNRQFQLDLNTLKVPEIDIGELWFFGAVSPDQSQFMLWGDMLKDRKCYLYKYPVKPPGN